jgi:hypothetical protein
MPKNQVTDPITDQEMAFARQVLAGGMTDRQAAEAVGLNPDSAAYTKAKPRVRDYMLEHRAAVEKQLVQQEAESQQRLNLDREKILTRLWEIAYLSPEMTRGSITGQVKAISMIIAIQGLIPDRHALSAVKKPALAPQIQTAAWPAKQQTTTIDDPQSSPAPARQKDSPGEPKPNTSVAKEAPALSRRTQSIIADLVRSSNPLPLPPSYDSFLAAIPYDILPSTMKMNPFVHRR